MTARAPGAGLLLGWLIATLASATIAHAQPVYLRRLVLPILEDTIGYPRAVTADLVMGEVFVCDTRKNRILIFDQEGLFRYQIEGGVTFSAPLDLAVDRDGFLFVLASHRRRRTLIELDFDGLFRRELPLQGLPEMPEGSPAPSLSSIAVSPDGSRLYLVDSANLILWISDRDGRILTAVDLAPGMGDDGRLDVILGKVDVYGDRVLLAVPSAGEIRAFDLDGSRPSRYGTKGTAPCQLGFPMAAALDSEGNLVIADQQRMLIIRWDTRTNRCLGEYYGIGVSPGYLYYPADLALDRSGQLFVAQGFQGRVQMYEGLAPAPALVRAPTETTEEARMAEGPEVEAPTVPTAAPPAGIAPAATVEAPIAQPEEGKESPDPATAVEEAVAFWALAWSEQRTEDYLGAYSSDFRPTDGADRDDWEALRRERLARPAWIEVNLSELTVQVEGDAARAGFVQAYRSDRFRDRVRKTLLLRLENGSWRIVAERVEDTP